MKSVTSQVHHKRERTAWKHLAASSRRRAMVSGELEQAGIRPSLLQPARPQAWKPWLLASLSVSTLLGFSALGWSLWALNQKDSNAPSITSAALGEQSTTASTQSTLAIGDAHLTDEPTSPDLLLVRQDEHDDASPQSHEVIESGEVFESHSLPRPPSKVAVSPRPKNNEPAAAVIRPPLRQAAQINQSQLSGSLAGSKEQVDPTSTKSRLIQFGSTQHTAEARESSGTTLTQPKPASTGILVLGVAVDGWLQVQNAATGRILSIAQGNTLPDGRKVVSATLERGYVLED